MTPPAETRGVAEAALQWVSEQRIGFALDEHALDAATDVNRTWKPLGELAQVCVCVCRHTPPGTSLHRAASDLLAFAWEQTRDGALFVDLQRLEPWASYPLEIYAAFASAGLRHHGYERFVSTIARTRGWRLLELLPNRRLGVLNSERRSGLPPHAEPAEELARTWLGGLPEPWTFERGAGYTLTHVVFHLTDWGRAVDRVPPHVASYVETWLPPWLDTCLEDEQWDLSCELLAIAASLPRPPDPAVVEAGWAAVAGAQEEHGALPEMGPGRHGRPVPRDFLHCYHSTLMAAYAGALTLARVGPDGARHAGPGGAREAASVEQGAAP
ncbi:hypothetical protein [Streptomyces sp. NPDC006307]|uniref:DUF6895 family protein n=1 Tax=Streptomyces sp. NPDC006307 TaxID=3156748 RepID=UPI0033A4F3FE